MLNYCAYIYIYAQRVNSIEYVALGAITETTNLMVYLLIKSLQLIWKTGDCTGILQKNVVNWNCKYCGNISWN